MKRFVIVPRDDARRNSLVTPDDQDAYYGDAFDGLVFETDGMRPVRFLGAEGGEPEDQTLSRDWAWVVDELNRAYESAIDACIEVVQEGDRATGEISAAGAHDLVENMKHLKRS